MTLFQGTIKGEMGEGQREGIAAPTPSGPTLVVALEVGLQRQHPEVIHARIVPVDHEQVRVMPGIPPARRPTTR